MNQHRLVPAPPNTGEATPDQEYQGPGVATTAPVASGSNLAARLTGGITDGSRPMIRSVGYDLRMFTMWKLTRRSHGGKDMGNWYARTRLPVSRRHNGGEGVHEDRETGKLVHLPIHWARKGWKLDDCSDDLKPWCADRSVYPNGFEHLPKGWEDVNAATAKREQTSVARAEGRQTDESRMDDLKALAALIKEGMSGRDPAIPTTLAFGVLADAAEALPPEERARLAARLQPIAGPKDRDPAEVAKGKGSTE